MSIRKIVSLKGIGRFESFAASGDVEFKKYTLVFADNGTGKTTLCDVIRSLQTGVPDHIVGRRTLGTTIDPEARILLSDGSTAVFQNGQWTRVLDDVTIFDANYVSQNVHAGEIVESGHRKNLFRVIVGEEGVRLAREVERLEEEKSALNTPIRDAKRAIEAGLNGIALASFLKLETDAEIDGKIATAQRTMATAQKADQVRQHRGFEEITVPVIPDGLDDVLATTLDGIGNEAERRVKEHIAAVDQPNAEKWVSSGMKYLTGETCPFCEQDVSGSDLIAAYRGYFSDAYGALSERVKRLRDETDRVLGEGAVSRFRMTIARNAEAARFWADHLTNPKTVQDVDQAAAEAACLTARETVLEVLDRKAATPLESVAGGEKLDAARRELDQIVSILAGYNTIVREANTRVEAQKGALDLADVDEVKQRLAALQLRKMRFAEPAVSQCAEYERLVKAKADLDKKKAAEKDKLERHTQRVMGEYESTLNTHLDRFLVGFRIQGTRTEHPRGYPSTSYSIVINGVPVDLGHEKTPVTEPSFKNTLSGGDRSALALSLFMAELDRATTPPGIAVILDDPFQSQDAFRQSATAHQIERCGRRCGQVIVMSHDARFLKRVWDLLPTDERKTLRLTSVGRGTALSPWDIDEHLKEAHQANLDALQRYLEQGFGAPRDVAQKLRPALEGYCRTICYGEFPDGTMMGEIISKVREEGQGHPLHAVLDELIELNDYARRYHHASNPNAGTEELNEAELRGYANRVLRLTRARLAT